MGKVESSMMVAGWWGEREEVIPGPEMKRMLRPSVGSLLTLLELFREARFFEIEVDFFLELGDVVVDVVVR